jgi:TolB-like protein/DNA-binding winged helix-turn-helix (wHTH) protein/Flp pilus assembly protein TadD
MHDPSARLTRLPGVVIDLHQRRVLRDDGSGVSLRPQAVELLCELALHAGEVVDKRRLLDVVWPGMVVTDDSLVQAVGDIRRAIGDERHQVLQTVPRRGYRLIVQPDEPPAEAAAADAEPSPAPATAAVATPARPQARAGWVVLATLAIAATALAAWWWPAGHTIHGMAPDRPPIAVLPFADAREGAGDPLVGRGFAEELAVELARNADLPVIATASTLAASDQGGDLRTVATRLKAGYLVDGSLQREGDSLRLRVRLVDGRDGQVAWTVAEDVPAEAVYRVRAALVERIATSMQASLTAREKQLVLQQPPASLDVYEMSLRALSLKHRFAPDANAEARRLLEEVLRRDPSFAPAWAYLGMAEGVDWLNQFSGPRRPELLASAVERLERARQLDPRLSAPYLGLAFTLPFKGRHAEAVTAGRRCVELAPSDAECRMFLAYALVSTGEAPEALTLSERAMALSPLPLSYMHNIHGYSLWATGRLDDAAAAHGRCLQLAPRFLICRTSRMLALAEAGRLDEAQAELATLRAGGIADRQLDALATSMFAKSGAALAERRRAALRGLLGAATAAR